MHLAILAGMLTDRAHEQRQELETLFDFALNLTSGGEGSLEVIFDLELSGSQPTLRRGSAGDSVRDLQNRLKAAGNDPGPVDGIFGPMTEAAVMAYQRAQRITVDGIVGPETWGRLLGTSGGTTPTTPTDRWVMPDDVRLAGEAQTVRYDSPPAWDGGRNCSGRFTAGADELKRYILANFSGVSSIGGYSCRQNTGNTSQTSVHGTGRAIDVMVPMVSGRANGGVGDPIANWLVRNASAIGVQYIIWNRVAWNGSRSGRKDATYTGPSPHTDHLHVELNNDGAAKRTPWFQGGGSGTPTGPTTPTVNWSSQTSTARMRYVMTRLVNVYNYPINGAAGVVGNLYAESGVIPSRLEGSAQATPMRAQDFSGRVVDFTPDQVMNRSSSARRGPRLPGVGLAQWTSTNRRIGLFRHSYNGRTLGSAIVYDMDAQIDYLVTELRTGYRSVDQVLRNPNVTLEAASDEVVYRFEVPGSVVGRPRTDPGVQQVFATRRGYSRQALTAFRGT